MLSNVEAQFRRRVFDTWRRAAEKLPLMVESDLVGGRIDVRLYALADTERLEPMSNFTWVLNRQMDIRENVRAILEWAWEDCPEVVRRVKKLAVSEETLKALKRLGKDVETEETWRIQQFSVKKDTLLVRCGDRNKLVKTKIPVTVLLHRMELEPDLEKRSALFFSKVAEITDLGGEQTS